MSGRLFLGSLLVAGGFALFLTGTTARSAEVGTGAQQASRGTTTSTIDDQRELALTVYNSGLALVRDVRDVVLASGTSDVEFADISATINPATVHLRSLSEPGQLSVVEQNYQYDLLEPEKLLRKYVGRQVTLVRRNAADGAAREESVTATLLAYNTGPVWKIGDEIVTGLAADLLRFPGVPENLRSRPTLVWTLDNDGAGRHRVEASYLAGDLRWSSDYVLTVARDDRTASVGGWVTVVNESGTDFRNARLQLVAGDLNRAKTGGERRDEMEAVMVQGAANASFAREAFSDYHLYSLDRRTTIANNETKQISLLRADIVPVEKAYVVEGQRFYYHNAQHPGAPLKDAVRVYYKLRNDTKSALGMPLPAGIVRVYQADSQGGLQFAGEDRIDHTPVDETVNLHVGNAFDIVCERNQTDFKALGGNLYELAFEITLRNRKASAVTVTVNEPIGGSWELLQSTHAPRKTAAWAAAFTVPVPAGGESTLAYRVRAKW